MTNSTDRQWHQWYAWRPVLIETDDHKMIVFWEDVLRRRVYLDGKWRWQYQPIENSHLVD